MKLKEYLSKNAVKKQYFAKQVGIHPSTLSRFLRYNQVSKTMALAIEALTKGEVTVKDFDITQ